ncbi:MAG: tetratricopeptide repeat protein [Desulfobulbaceae bacterium]|nr:tetratricopeptide repeat protein [Desulfobulbaceae bacterium]
MEVKELIQAGKLAEARQLLVAAVKASPADPVSRTLLFQVLCYSGEWDKADRHLQAIATQDSGREAGALGYRNIIQAEMERREVAGSNQSASFLSEPPDYLDLFLQIRKKLSEKNESEAATLLAELDSLRPSISGTVNDTAFSGFCDTDTTLFPFLEVIAHERYLWVPFESIRELSLSAPESLLDLLWVSARITTWEGFAMNCYLPVVYPHSYLHEDERIKMGRMTDWQALAGSYAQGMGQHVYDVGGKDMAILEIQDIVFNFPGKEESDE